MQDFQKQMEQQIERRGRSEEKRSAWQPYRVALSDEAGTHGNEPGSDPLNEEDSEDDDAVYGKPIKYTYANTKNKDNKWSSNRRAGMVAKRHFLLIDFCSAIKFFTMLLKPVMKSWKFTG